MKVKQEWFTIYEAAELLGVHHNTIRNRIKDGSLDAARIGWDWRISREAINNFMKPQKPRRRSATKRDSSRKGVVKSDTPTKK